MEVRNIQKRTKKSLSPIGFWGVKGVIFLVFITLFYKVISALPFPGFIRSLSTVKRVSSLFGIPYENIHDMNSKKTIDLIKRIAPDVVVSFQHQIFKDDLLNIPGIKFINCHPSLLPKYRGVKPIFWSMLNNDNEFGVTVHEMRSDIDCGGILSQNVIKYHPDWTLFQNYTAAYEVSVDTIHKAVDFISKKRLVACFIDSSDKYYVGPNKGDVKKFNKKHKII
jgi:methionyl-tRNA formyltransferase